MNEASSVRMKRYDDVIRRAQVLLSVARDSDLQRAAIGELNRLSTMLAEWKKETIGLGNEDDANLILGFESVTDAVRSELTMWILLKEEKPELAWDSLIAAQTSTSHAVRAHTQFASLENHAMRLDAIEKLVFPPQIFLSAGMIVRTEICSICEKDYADCDHLVGMPYWGQFCFRRLKDITPDHVAIVKEPANKLCRLTHFSVEGGTRNRMTWRVEPSKEQPETNPAGKEGLLTKAIILTTHDLES